MISHFQIVSTPNLYSNETDELQSFEKKNMFQNFFMFQILEILLLLFVSGSFTHTSIFQLFNPV